MSSRITILELTIVVVVALGCTSTGVVAMTRADDVSAAVNGSDRRPTSGENVTSSEGRLAACPPTARHVGLRYVIATFEFEHVKMPFIVAAWVLFVTLAKIGTGCLVQS